MTIRTFALVTLVMVMGSATGCSGMKNFLFGRGAQCGLFKHGGAAPVNPYAPAQPAAPGCGLFPRCGLLNRNPAPTYTPPYAVRPPATCAPPTGYAPMATCPDAYQGGYVGSGCVDGAYAAGMAGDCGCNPTCGTAPYQGGVVDPYLGGGMNQGGYPLDGGYSDGGMIQGDGFQPRTYQSNRVDVHGDRIISAEPLPPGARLVD